MFSSSLQYQRQIAADRHEQLRRQAGAARLRRDLRAAQRERHRIRRDRSD